MGYRYPTPLPQLASFRCLRSAVTAHMTVAEPLILMGESAGGNIALQLAACLTEPSLMKQLRQALREESRRGRRASGSLRKGRKATAFTRLLCNPFPNACYATQFVCTLSHLDYIDSMLAAVRSAASELEDSWEAWTSALDFDFPAVAKVTESGRAHTT